MFAINSTARMIFLYVATCLPLVVAVDWLISWPLPYFPWSVELLKATIFVLLTSAILFLFLRREGLRRDLVERDLRAQVIYDPLTGLLNRACFAENLEKAVAQASRDRTRKIGVIFLDLDGFKSVNDRFGHHVGDDLLVEVSNRIRQVVRTADCAARFGGDEFVVLVNQGGDEGTERLAERLVDILRKPFEIKAEEVALTGSVGYAIYPDHGREAGQLIRAADLAMYRVKETGKDAARPA